MVLFSQVEREGCIMPSAIWKTSGRCALAIILLALAAPVQAGDSGGGDGGGNDRFKNLDPIAKWREEERAEERDQRNRNRHAAGVVGALDGLQGSEPGDSVTTP
jgi:hypothetical protein